MNNISLKDLKNYKYRINPEERQGSYGYYFVRPISLYATYLALRLGLSANQVTALQILIGVFGCVALAFGQTNYQIAGILLLQFGFVLDNVDGEVARFRQQVSLTGKYLDAVGHAIVVPMLYFGLGIGNYFAIGHFESVVYGFLAGFFSLRFDYSTMYQEAAQLIESRLDETYDYYSNLSAEKSAVESMYRRKNEESSIRMLFALFAYPATMNIISALILLDLIIPRLAVANYEINLVYLFLTIYGILLPIRRIITISKLVSGREVERKYIALLDLLRTLQK